MRRVRGVRLCMVVAVGVAGAAAAGQAPLEELKKLEGGWLVVAAEQRGRPFEVIKGGALVIEGSTFYLKTAAGNEFRGEIRIDPSKSPKHLDFIHEKGGPVWEAIYTLTDDTFRINYAETGDGDARPTIFATSSDTSGTIVVMERMAAR